MLHAGAWSDVGIRNVSARGMMMWSDRPPAAGSYVEVRRATHIIVARIVWVKGPLFGVRTQDVLNVRDMLDGGASAPRQLEGGRNDRRRAPRPPAVQEDTSRHLARRLQFAGVVAFAVVAAGLAAVGIATLFRAPLDRVAAAMVPPD